PSGLSAAWPWFLVSAVLIIALALLVADRLGRRFVRPLQAAQVVTGHIAEGDLSARVPEPAGTDPELAALSASINAMAERLARARGSERQFLLSVSHELRTPLTSIRGFAEAIEDGAATDTRRAASIIASESRRLERLVGDLLDLAKLEARRFSLNPRTVDLAESVMATAAGFEPTAAELGLALVVGVSDAGPLLATADPDRLAQVIANLIENALRYARTEVRVAAAESGGQAVLWVDDDGPGIGPGDLESLFARRPAERPPGRTVGSGLGLPIVWELASAMGGSVRAESPTGSDGGTRLVVTLPPPG
ncbi:MAG: sensor histidine kinase, partial [Acidimicrobiales bacterium]